MIKKLDRKLLDVIKKKVDIVEVAEELGMKLTKTSSDRFSSICPLPGHLDHNPSFSIFVTSQVFHCFGCQAHGDVFDLIKILKDVSFLMAVQWVCDKVNISIEDFESKSNEFDWEDRVYTETELDYNDIMLFDSMKVRDTLQKIAREYGEDSEKFSDAFEKYGELCSNFARASSPAVKDLLVSEMKRFNNSLEENYIENRSNR